MDAPSVARKTRYRQARRKNYEIQVHVFRNLVPQKLYLLEDYTRLTAHKYSLIQATLTKESKIPNFTTQFLTGLGMLPPTTQNKAVITNNSFVLFRQDWLFYLVCFIGAGTFTET
jgi:hypothetical protein